MTVLVLHVYIMGKDGIEQAHDFLQNDGKEEMTGIDIIIPYAEREELPVVSEADTLMLLRNKNLGREH